MKKIIVLCMMVIFVHCSVSSAAPKITELESNQTPLTIKPIFPDVPREWKWHQKSFESSVVIIYLSPEGDFIMSISQENKRPIDSATNTKSTVVNNTTYFYDAWISKDDGWMIRWVKGDSYFEMNSDKLSLDEMIKIAETISRKLN